MKQIKTYFNQFECHIYPIIPPTRQVGSYRNIHKLHVSIRKFSWQLFLALVLNITIPASDVYSQDRSEVELINFAFSNYLGTGFYASDSGEVFILKIPMSTTLRPMSGTMDTKCTG